MRLLIGLFTLTVAAPAFAQERIDLATPETKPSNGQYRLQHEDREWDDPATVNVDEGRLTLTLAGQNAESVTCVYNATTTPTATFLNNALNKANLSSAYNNNATTGSMKQRLFHRLIVIGESGTICSKELVGVLAGSPQ